MRKRRLKQFGISALLALMALVAGMDSFAMASNDFNENLIPVLLDFWNKALEEP